MTLGAFMVAASACMFTQQPMPACIQDIIAEPTRPAVTSRVPFFSGTSLDVIVSSKSYIVWDVSSGTVLKEKNAEEERPIASINKLVSLLAIRKLLPLSQVVEIPIDVRSAQRQGADVELPIGEHARVSDLIAAAMIPSANDAMVALAVAAKGSEEAFVTYANEFAKSIGLEHTVLANATGLHGGTQHSTAQDVQHMIMLAYEDPVLRNAMTQEAGDLITLEGTRKHYVSTDKLLGTYLPILAGKTGYTIEAGENVTIITQGPTGKPLGVVVLGSESRFYDAKVLVEWVVRNFTWSSF